MKKKGFTLVELLAVIAILAILVIVAMPNVLGMFNQAKSSTFATEVKTLMDTATTDFMRLALTKPAANIVFSSDGNGDGKLDMDGATKDYYITMDRYGNFTNVVVWDDNFCYDTKLVTGTIEKTSVLEAHIHTSDEDDDKDGCEGDLLTDLN